MKLKTIIKSLHILRNETEPKTLFTRNVNVAV